MNRDDTASMLEAKSPLTIYVVVPSDRNETESDYPEIRELMAMGFMPAQRIELMSPADHSRVTLRAWEHLAADRR